MKTWVCTNENCQYSWEQEEQPLLCPSCDERKVLRERRNWIERKAWDDRKERMYGRAVSDRERVCEGCAAPLRGYSERVHDPITGITTIDCDDCGYEHIIEEVEPSQRRSQPQG